MGWRTVVVTGRAKLDLKMNHLIVRKDEITKVHINEINLLIIESTTVSITIALLSELSKAKVKVIFCDEKHNPFGELTSYYNKHNTSLMVKKQVNWDYNNKLKIWTKIIKEKIHRQSKVLGKNNRTEAFSLLNKYLEEIESGDATNREGHAAKVYFNSLFGMDFIRGNDEPFNSSLNYGYSILLSCFNREVVANGYITQLGIFHDNQFNQYNLSSDLMEPLRPIVDEMVYRLQPNDFGKEEKLFILNIIEHSVYIDGKNCTLLNAIGIYCKSVFDALEQNNPGLIKWVEYEL